MTNQTIKPEFSRVYLIFIFLFFVNTQLFSQNFITKWNFTAAGTSISFNAQTAGGPVNYTWTCAPSGNTGSGSATHPSPLARRQAGNVSSHRPLCDGAALVAQNRSESPSTTAPLDAHSDLVPQQARSRQDLGA